MSPDPRPLAVAAMPLHSVTMPSGLAVYGIRSDKKTRSVPYTASPEGVGPSTERCDDRSLWWEAVRGRWRCAP